MTDARFPRLARVRARADFDRIFQDGKRTALPSLALHWLRDATPARLGLAVSRKVDVRAVVRNRIKRALREHFRQSRSRLAPGAYVVVARRPAATASPATLRADLQALLTRAGALPPPALDGTMPAADSRPAFPPPPSTTPRATGE